MMNGILNIYKEEDYTSFDVVAKLRGILKQKKIGHTGTLDPKARGVLPVCVGKATKVCALLTDKDKEYEAVLLLGTVTDTQDMTGRVLKETPVSVSEGEARAAIESFVGPYRQIPPMYSALKVNGQKLCDLARAGTEIERKPREVHIYGIEILQMDLPRIKIRVRCSKGTYIRTLCEDIGEKLSCGGCMESLLRTAVADFSLSKAHKLAEIELAVKEGRIGEYLMPVDSVFTQYPRAVVKKQFEKPLYNGNRLSVGFCRHFSREWSDTKIRVYDEAEQFIGIYEYLEAEAALKPVKIFV